MAVYTIISLQCFTISIDHVNELVCNESLSVISPWTFKVKFPLSAELVVYIKNLSLAVSKVTPLGRATPLD